MTTAINIGDLVEREHGHRNWVLARRTKNIINRYGDNVVCLSPKAFLRLEDQAEYENAPFHDAAELIGKLIREQYPVAGFIRALRSEGWRIEKVAL